jgi:biotin-(acetyl-CoA carboxylase) ligase
VARAGALFREDPGPEAAPRLAAAWAEGLLGVVASGPSGWGREDYAARCLTLGREITWEPAGRGRAAGVALDGGLEVDTPAGRRVLYAGEVHTVRPA